MISRWERPNSITSSKDIRYLDYVEILKLVAIELKKNDVYQEQKSNFITVGIINLMRRYAMIAQAHKEAFFQKIKTYFMELNLKSDDMGPLPNFCVQNYGNALRSENSQQFEEMFSVVELPMGYLW